MTVSPLILLLIGGTALISVAFIPRLFWSEQIFVQKLIQFNQTNGFVSRFRRIEFQMYSQFSGRNIFREKKEILISKRAKELPLNGSILCFVETTPKFHSSRVPAINLTWIPLLDHGVFFTSEQMSDENIPFRTVFNSLDDDYSKLFEKTRLGFHYAFTEISSDFDWYMKADDDTFVVVENLRFFLKAFDPQIPLYIGYRFGKHLDNGYNSGGAGYILSRAAVRLFVEKLFGNPSNCPFNPNEDVGMGKCLESIGIYPIDTRDSRGRSRFHPHHFGQILNDLQNPENHWASESNDGRKIGFEEFSSELITLHHLSGPEIIAADFFLHRIRVPNSTNVRADSAPLDRAENSSEDISKH